MITFVTTDVSVLKGFLNNIVQRSCYYCSVKLQWRLKAPVLLCISLGYASSKHSRKQASTKMEKAQLCRYCACFQDSQEKFPVLTLFRHLCESGKVTVNTSPRLQHSSYSCWQCTSILEVWVPILLTSIKIIQLVKIRFHWSNL